MSLSSPETRAGAPAHGTHGTDGHGAGASRLRKASIWDRTLAQGSVVSIALFFIVVCVIFSTVTDAFLTAPNLLNIIRQSAPLLIVAAAMTFVITTGGIDLSVGSVLALVATLSATSLQAGIPWPVVILVMLALGALIGAIQGFFIAYERIPAFIVTLAGLSVIRGLALLITGGYSIPVDPGSVFTLIGRAWFLGVPVPALIALVVLAVAYVVFNRTPFGRYVTGIGANAEAVRRAGVDTRFTTLFVYILSSASAALAGIIVTARLGSGSSNAGQGFELEVIAAVVLGGTSLFGGRGTLVGTVLGALTVAVIANGLILAHMSPFLTPIVTGTIILVAVWLNFRLFRGAVRGR
jgi:simple sugar transport system permease protein